MSRILIIDNDDVDMCSLLVVICSVKGLRLIRRITVRGQIQIFKESNFDVVLCI